jgi:transmembrane sensor
MGTIVGFPDRAEVAREAAQWLIRLDGDNPPTQEELTELGEWLHRSALHREELESIAALWGRMNVLTELAVPLGQESRAGTRSYAAQPVGMTQPRRLRPALLLASIAALAVLVVILVARDPAVDPLLTTNGLYATAVGQQDTKTLADGSRVMLNTNSQIKVEYSDGHRRVYLLQGEALFTVAKNAQRPFRVYAGNGLIEAVGTAFSVYLKEMEVDVAVTEGRVALASIKPSANSGASESTQSLGLLSAGEVATIRTPSSAPTAGSAVVLDEVEQIPSQQLAQRLAWREGVLLFSGETLENVVKELGRYTTVSIEIPDETVRSMRVGGRFPVGETETMLSALESNFNLRVIHLSHNRVVLAPADE